MDALSVYSRHSADFNLGARASWYASVGAGWLSFVDPEAQTLGVSRNDAGAWRSTGCWQGSVDVSGPPFEALTWPLGSLWG